MTDSDDEPEGRGCRPTEECAARGLLPREHYRPGATLEVRTAPPESGVERLYRPVPVCVDGAETTLLVGTWCELETGTSYRVAASRSDAADRRLVTVSITD